MNRATRKKIDKAFYNYRENLCRGAKSVVEWAESNFAVNYTAPRVQSSPTGKREARLCAIIDENENSYKWCRVVENVLIKYHGDYKKLLIEQRFFYKKSIDKITILLCVDRSTVFRWLNEIRESAFAWARDYKLVED